MEDAVARRERLKTLRAAADVSGTAQPTAEQAEPEKPVLKFRNYAVRDKKIEHDKVRIIPQTLLLKQQRSSDCGCRAWE